MRRINTLSELRNERRRLKSRRKFLEKEIKKEFTQLRESLKPVNLISNTAKNTIVSENTGLLGNSIGQVADFLARTALKRSGFLTRLVVPYLIKNVTSNIVERNKSKIGHWVGNVLLGLSRKKVMTGHHSK